MIVGKGILATITVGLIALSVRRTGNLLIAVVVGVLTMALLRRFS